MMRDVTTHTERRRVRVRIEGRVQGVGFRAFVQREAIARGIDGYVRNRRDGGVEAVFDGLTEAVDAMLVCCRRGPRGSRVDMCKVLDENCDVANGFAIHAPV
jgi:acylphosphatase